MTNDVVDVPADRSGGRRVLRRANSRPVGSGERRRLIGLIAKLKADNQLLHDAYEAISRDQARSWINMQEMNALQRKIICQVAGRNVVGLMVD